MRLLVIEDFAVLRTSLVRGLRELGYAVDEASDGKQGLALAQQHTYDVVILDLMLPQKSGIEVLAELRASGNTVHVLVLTAKDSVEDRIAGLDHGADDYLIKPFAFDELTARIRALVRRSYQRPNPIIRVADLEIDTLKRSVRRGGDVVPLSAREYALLEYLASRVGQVVTRVEIWEHVYDSVGEPWSNVLDVYISHLRRKIDQGRTPKLIHTRRGHGYLFGEDQS
jgi:DNA-binding response OmpR family regulator